MTTRLTKTQSHRQLLDDQHEGWPAVSRSDAGSDVVAAAGSATAAAVGGGGGGRRSV